MGTVRERAEDEAINVFARNLRSADGRPAGVARRWASTWVCVPA